MAHERVRESEAAPLRQAASRRIQQQTYEAITTWMNAEGYRTTRGGRWRPSVLANVLDHPAIAGLAEDADGNLVDSGGPRIIQPEEFKAIRAVRRLNDPTYRRAEQREYLMTGELTDCGLCGGIFGASPANSGSRGYRCLPNRPQHPGGCGRVRISADPFETYVAEHVVAELAKPEVSALIGQAREEILAEAAKLRAQVKADKARQKELGESYARSPDLSLSAFRAADKQLTDQIRENAAQARFLEQVRHVPVGAVPDLVRWWRHAPLASKQGVLTLMLERVTVYPAAARGSRTVDGDRVQLTWRKWNPSQRDSAVTAG
ncbi:recombinase family protein [Streptomyces violaceusniger]|uniref:recombinase family protein n=1 Tax=Streptomyces violaceusniger TaxID=68280 RepID=UPI00142F31C8|nr:recombinase family protein [Streptomyces violaceusniger]